MSSTNRGKHTTENWETPMWCVRRLLEEVSLPGGLWLEPCAGNGRIIQAVEEMRPRRCKWHAVEKREECAPKLRDLGIPLTLYCPKDFLKEWNARKLAKKYGVDISNGQRYLDVSITNPPFSLALDVALKCLAISDHVVILQRSNWTGGGSNNGKNDFFRSMPPSIFPVPDRIRFMLEGVYPRYPEGTLDGHGKDISGTLMPGDSIEYSWYYWGPDRVREYGLYKNLASTSVEERQTG